MIAHISLGLAALSFALTGLAPPAMEEAWNAWRSAERLSAALAEIEEINGPYSEREISRGSAAAAPYKAGVECQISREISPQVEQWRSSIAPHLSGCFLDEFLSVMQCESGGNPAALGKANDAGLMQFIPSTWGPGHPAYAGTDGGFGGGADPFDPAANIAAALRLRSWSIQIGIHRWHHWSCKP